jgi:hypothetical protein
LIGRPKGLTTKEAAGLLNEMGCRVTPRTVRRWIREGAMPHWHPNQKELLTCEGYLVAFARRVHLRPYRVPGCALLPPGEIPPPCPPLCPLRKAVKEVSVGVGVGRG